MTSFDTVNRFDPHCNFGSALFAESVKVLKQAGWKPQVTIACGAVRSGGDTCNFAPWDYQPGVDQPVRVFVTCHSQRIYRKGEVIARLVPAWLRRIFGLPAVAVSSVDMSEINR